jgi:hypothetical protein
MACAFLCISATAAWSRGQPGSDCCLTPFPATPALLALYARERGLLVSGSVWRRRAVGRVARGLVKRAMEASGRAIEALTGALALGAVARSS